VMKGEFARATWESSEILQNLLPHGMEMVNAVYSELKKQDLSPAYFQPKSKGNTWPKDGRESTYYEPVTHILNATLKAALRRQRKTTYYSSLQFSVYDKPVADGIDDSHPLKPDSLGCNREILPDEKVPWRDIRIAVEVKNNWPDLVVQAATYSRCMFASSRGQTYNIVIGFHYKRRELRFLFFHRGGVTAYLADLTTDVGWRRLVAAMVGLASVPDRDSAGMDSSRDNFHFNLPAVGLCAIVQPICTRDCVRGRATYVAKLNRGES
jgi:hypothetical protein